MGHRRKPHCSFQKIRKSKSSVSKLVKRTNELKYFFGLCYYYYCYIIFGFGNIVADFHV